MMREAVAISDCVNNLELHYFYFIQRTNFSEATTTCEGLEDGSLAVPKDEDFFRRMQDFKMSASVSSIKAALIGLKDFEDTGGSGVTTRFSSFFDRSTPAFTSGVAGEFPWFLSQPNGGENGNENCVTMFGVPQLLSDVNCNGFHPEFMCQAACISPTILPTKAPTRFPTIFPTFFPSPFPTRFPSTFPSESLTPNPSNSPSMSPVGVTVAQSNDSFIIIMGIGITIPCFLLGIIVGVFVLRRKKVFLEATNVPVAEVAPDQEETSNVVDPLPETTVEEDIIMLDSLLGSEV